MAGFSDIFQKAVYLGVGFASYAGEKAGLKLAEIQVQVQKLADEMVRRGEMSTEEARQWVEEFMNQEGSAPTSPTNPPQQPRQIEISAEEPESAQPENVETLRDQVQDLRDELHRLQD